MSEQNFLPYSDVDPRSDRGVGPRQRVRPPADLSARDPAARLAAHQARRCSSARPRRHARRPRVSGAARRAPRYESPTVRSEAADRRRSHLDRRPEVRRDGQPDVDDDRQRRAWPGRRRSTRSALALAGCMSIDVVHILTRGPPSAARPARRIWSPSARRRIPHRFVQRRRCTSSSKATCPPTAVERADRAVAREVLLGLALAAAGHFDVRVDVGRRHASDEPVSRAVTPAPTSTGRAASPSCS